MANVSKSDLIDAVASDTGMAKKDAKAALDSTLNHIEMHLKNGDKVTLTGFGIFETRERAARQGVKPGTSEKIDIPASTYPAFKAGKSLKDSIKR